MAITPTIWAICRLNAAPRQSSRTPRPAKRYALRAQRPKRPDQAPFGRLKNDRRMATRYDKLPRYFLAAIAIVATIIRWAASGLGPVEYPQHLFPGGPSLKASEPVDFNELFGRSIRQPNVGDIPLA
ncbi:MAG: transposase [Geminicoccaceae bacterium]